MSEIAGTGIACPECAWPCDRIVNSRKKEGFVTRRRECIRCGHRVTTREILTETDIRVTVRVPLRLVWSKNGKGLTAESPLEPDE